MSNLESDALREVQVETVSLKMGAVSASLSSPAGAAQGGIEPKPKGSDLLRRQGGGEVSPRGNWCIDLDRAMAAWVSWRISSITDM
mmetsp:Transcript_53407/g.154043  ORF Transcript_53407/g.154043 Transcript_53407/m.154043 type:complete len:86 (-) Transcript_53407:473-730(-)